jgi:hypothetical protein
MPIRVRTADGKERVLPDGLVLASGEGEERTYEFPGPKGKRISFRRDEIRGWSQTDDTDGDETKQTQAPPEQHTPPVVEEPPEEPQDQAEGDGEPE